MKIEYRKAGDYCMPNLTIQEKLKRNRLGINSSLRREHLKQNKKRKLRELKTKNQIELLRRMNTISKIIDKYILKECAYKDKI
jgi:hypothetical protein